MPACADARNDKTKSESVLCRQKISGYGQLRRWLSVPADRTILARRSELASRRAGADESFQAELCSRGIRSFRGRHVEAYPHRLRRVSSGQTVRTMCDDNGRSGIRRKKWAGAFEDSCLVSKPQRESSIRS